MLFRIPKHVQRIQRLVDDELPAHEKAVCENQAAQDPDDVKMKREIEQIGDLLRETSHVSLTAQESAEFMQQLRERTREESPVPPLRARLLDLWEALAFPLWKPAVAVAIVLGITAVPLSGLLLPPDIGSGEDGMATVESDIPEATILILSGSEEGSDRVWVLASNS